MCVQYCTKKEKNLYSVIEVTYCFKPCKLVSRGHFTSQNCQLSNCGCKRCIQEIGSAVHQSACMVALSV